MRCVIHALSEFRCHLSDTGTDLLTGVPGPRALRGRRILSLLRGLLIKVKRA